MEKILYVEDDLSLIDGLQYTLEASGYAVDNARTVKEALTLFRNTHLRFAAIRCYFAGWDRNSIYVKRYGTVPQCLSYF